MSYDTIRDRNQRPERGSLHACAVPGCEKMIERKLLMCLAHWRAVPAPLRHAVSDTYHGGGTGAYLAARKAAIESVSGGQS